jgi:hypothetical protein
MPIVKHIAGGSVSFVHNGQRITAGSGYVGDIPTRILAKHPKRFAVVDEPFPRVTADVKRDEVLTREPAKVDPAKEVKLGRYLARHRGAGKWAVTETESGKVVSEMMPRVDAEKLAEEMNTK